MPLSLSIKRQRHFYLCGTTLVPLKTALECAVSGATGAAYTPKRGVGAQLGGDTRMGITAASHQMAAL